MSEFFLPMSIWDIASPSCMLVILAFFTLHPYYGQLNGNVSCIVKLNMIETLTVFFLPGKCKSNEQINSLRFYKPTLVLAERR